MREGERERAHNSIGLPTSPTLLKAKKSVPATRSASPIRGFKPSKRQIQVCVIVDTVLINNNVKFSVMN